MMSMAQIWYVCLICDSNHLLLSSRNWYAELLWIVNINVQTVPLSMIAAKLLLFLELS